MNIGLVICLIVALVYSLVQLWKSKTSISKLRADIDDVVNNANAKASKSNERIVGLERQHSEIVQELSRYKTENDLYLPLIQQFKTLEAVKNKVEETNARLAQSESALEGISTKLNVASTHKELVDSGFFTYKYDFEEILHYKEALQILKERQRLLIFAKEAVTCSDKDLEDSIIVKNLSKILLTAFNNEIELIAARMSSSNFESCQKNASDSFDSLNELASVFKCRINKTFLTLKIKELAVGLEYELELQKIRDQQNELKEQMRDEEKAREEAEAKREKALKIELQYQDMLDAAKRDAQSATQGDQEKMLAKIVELQTKLDAAHLERERATSQAQLTKRGHIYIISNIGSFGEEVFKIGLTRREDPMERVKELGDASVPFTFDVHAFIRSEDAPALEASLHQRLNEHRMNKVNTRKEFFRVPIDKIAETCKALGCEVTLSHMAEARDFRKTLELQKQNRKAA